EDDLELAGFLRRCGNQTPISDVEVSASILGIEKRTKSDTNGSFSVLLPKHSIYDLNFKSEDGSLDISSQIGPPSSSSPIPFFLARSCHNNAHETFLIEKVCDDLEIAFVHIPSGPFQMGLLDDTQEVPVKEFSI